MTRLHSAAWLTLLRAKLRDRVVVASVSGGKDSAAMSLYLKELGIDHVRVFADTGWEHPKTYEYLRGELTRVIGPIVEVRGALTLPELARKKGIFPSRRKRYCTDLLKVAPIGAYLNSLDVEPVNTIGVRAEESAERAMMPKWEWSDAFNVETWRPIIDWSLDDVIAIHKRHGLAPNPLYLLGAERVGCFPCINAGRGELLLLDRIAPERIAEIRELERAVTERARDVVGARGESLLHPRSLLRERGTTFGADIDGQIAWARSNQVDKFASAADRGCARWGMCESAPKSTNARWSQMDLFAGVDDEETA